MTEFDGEFDSPTSPEPATRPRRDLQLRVALGLIGGSLVLGAVALIMAERAALRRAIGDARALTDSLLEYTDQRDARPTPAAPPPATNTAPDFTPRVVPVNGYGTATPGPNGHVAPAVPITPAYGTPPASALPKPVGVPQTGEPASDGDTDPPADA